MKDKKLRQLFGYVESWNESVFTNALAEEEKKVKALQEKAQKQAKQIESLADKIESMDKTLDSFGFRSCPKCKRGTMTINYHYLRPFDVKEDGTLYKRPEYECLVCGTKYDLKEQPVIKED